MVLEQPQVRSQERCLLISIKQPTDILVLEESYRQMQQHKIQFLKSIPHYKYCSDESLQRMACNMRRKYYRPKSVIAVEGTEASHVFFLVQGKLQVSQGGQAVAVLGVGATVGDWGVISGPFESQRFQPQHAAVLSTAARSSSAPKFCFRTQVLRYSHKTCSDSNGSMVGRTWRHYLDATRVVCRDDGQTYSLALVHHRV